MRARNQRARAPSRKTEAAAALASSKPSCPRSMSLRAAMYDLLATGFGPGYNGPL
jgi:hypothetical protein